MSQAIELNTLDWFSYLNSDVQFVIPWITAYFIMSALQLPHLWTASFNTLSPRQNCHHFGGVIFKWIFLNEFHLRFHWIDNIPALVQIMAWHWPGDKPLSEPMMVCLPVHICITRLQWVNFKQKYFWGCVLCITNFVLEILQCHQWLTRQVQGHSEEVTIWMKYIFVMQW